MTNLSTILNAADKAAVIEANFEKLDALIKLLDGTATWRLKDGQLQSYDATAAGWRPFGVDNGQPVFGDVVAE